jgi:hypothetical protein
MKTLLRKTAKIHFFLWKSVPVIFMFLINKLFMSYSLPKTAGSLVCFLFLLLFVQEIKAQNPQFAVVRPDGTTFICPTFDSAYNKAVDGDFLYLPGGVFTFNQSLTKRIFIYGAGIHPDSSKATGRTQITAVNNSLYITKSAEGGLIEGVEFTNTNLFFSYSGKQIKGFTLRRCTWFGSMHFKNGSEPTDSLPTNILIEECIIGNGILLDSARGNLFSKNLIKNYVNRASFCTFQNNIFTFNFSGSGPLIEISNCTFQNNIFFADVLRCSGCPNTSICSNTFLNNLKPNSPILLSNQCPPSSGFESGTIVSPTQMTDNFEVWSGQGEFKDNYRLKATSPGKNAGTDGTDVGIYGTVNPTSAGWVPSNPHIYFKQIAPQTGTNGTLNIQVKVRTNN